MALTKSDEEEWGRELLPSELRVKTVVIVSRDGQRGVTAWVTAIDAMVVWLSMEKIKTTLILRRLKDETLVDDTEKRVRLFEYKGEV